MVMEEQQSDMELASERIPVPQVQRTTEEPHVEPSSKVTSSSRVKPRLRKKALHAAILKQMEFYFSDANLSKDRFLCNLIKKNPYVDLNVFTTFNRIRELTADTSRIAKALHASTVLQLSDDGTKVQRVTPVESKDNIDDCTIYVQNLPPDADHEMLSTIFSQYGQVVYVSVPKYKSNKKIKGFAFVEFNEPEHAQKCLKIFQKKGCVLPSNTSPIDILSISTFDNIEKDITQCGKLMQSNENNMDVEDDNVANLETQEPQTDKEDKQISIDKVMETDEIKESKKAKKRKRVSSTSHEADNVEHNNLNEENECEADSENTSSRKVKNEAQNDLQEKETTTANKLLPKANIKKFKKGINDIDKNEMESGDHGSTEDTEIRDIDMADDGNEKHDKNSDRKKKKKRKRRSRLEEDNYTMGLQIMSKKNWKILRNKYLTLQRTKMKQLKQHLRKTRWNQLSNYEKNKAEKEDNDEKDTSIKQENSTGCRYTFAPGVIVKITMDKPCSDPKSFKMELRGNSSVKYIDVEEGSYHAYIRCDTSEAAQSFAQKSSEERQMTILQGEEEKMYWDKIAQDREEKVGKKVRVKQRGRDKLLKRAEKALGKHIKFDEV